ncbi:F-box/WD repeat-containing protein 5-like [Pomacea canaliculata]|uniref:F-box/WD repeat-containing protein 5-like n=1 Tax=Pomacea canaliculata TaxID=400727 RepID=UPI000D727F31|nr:F-box/WD repeat-containing protein 5-like [Pomacea canaliculata]XP_025112435.1 F-box/WD repeat-containing protein 5-like [Pomacea canaliculata]XP_025112436.1 F-box/WD repeat-containing protein 5-like [Pomacea canaliculata]
MATEFLTLDIHLKLCNLPDSLLLEIFSHLSPKCLGRLACVCSHFRRIVSDELLWKNMFIRHFKVPQSVPLLPGATSWRIEYQRLCDRTPEVLHQELQGHTDEVLHVSFSHNGRMFATTSKDRHIMVWNVGKSCTLKFSLNMSIFGWQRTRCPKFNKSDTLLLVSGPTLSSGEIAIVDLEYHCVRATFTNDPYCVNGAWYNDSYFLSGALKEVGLSFISSVKMNKVSQESNSENVDLYHFRNSGGSFISSFIITDLNNACDYRFPQVTSDEAKSLGQFTHSSTHCRNNSSGKSEASDCCIMESDIQRKIDTVNGGTGDRMKIASPEDRLLIFSMGVDMHVPHAVGIKLMHLKDVEMAQNCQFPARTVGEAPQQLEGRAEKPDDTIDHVIDMHGRIIDMALSPDQRYLYVNTRPWTQPLQKTRNVRRSFTIAQEIEIHVIDLSTFLEVGLVFRSHKAHTKEYNCAFLFLDVSKHYVASGSDDKQGYLWDRHYGICLNHFPHDDVVNTVAFNPCDEEMLVTVGDDHKIKVWYSRHKKRQVKGYC